MTIREFAEYCKSINIDCGKGEKKELCQHMLCLLGDISPCGVVKLVDKNEEL